MSKLYVLYDERAYFDVDEAAVLCTADSLEEARADKRDLFPLAVIYEYDLVGDEARNGRQVS